MPATCPDRTELSDLVFGKMDEPQLTEVAKHIETCEDCQTTIGLLEENEDTFIEAIRERALADEMADEPPFHAALARIEEIGREPVPDDQLRKEESPGRLREYRLLAKLGEGGMGTVYKALHTRLQRVVALKLLASHRRHDAAVVERFAREIEAVGKLSHPNIVTAHDAGEEDGVHYLVMELVDGVDLHTLVKQRGPLPVADACEIIRQAALGLQHAHEHGLVHRDLKPSNLMLSPMRKSEVGMRRDNDSETSAFRTPISAFVKILDLGLALRQGEQAASQHLTGTGQVMGTLDYMAPEQADDSHGVDIRADIYALGCTLYTLLTGQAPFAGEAYNTPAKKIVAHAQTPPEPIESRRDDVPQELGDLLKRMLAKDPQQRPASPGEVAAALKPLAADHDLGKLAAENSAAAPLDIPIATADEIPGMIGSGGGFPGRSLPNGPRSPRHGRGGFWFWTGLTMIGVAVICLVNTLSGMIQAFSNQALSPSGLAHFIQHSLHPMMLGGPAFVFGLIFVIIGLVRRWQRAAVVEKTPVTAPARGRHWLGAAAALAVLIAGGLAVVMVTTRHGELTIETNDPDVRVEVRAADGDSAQIAVVDNKSGSRVRLAPGKYGVRVIGDGAEYEIDKGTLTIRRGERVLVKVIRKPKPSGDQDGNDPSGVIVNNDDEPAASRSTESLYSGKPLSYWAEQLKDRDPDYRDKAVDAMVRFGAAGADPLIAMLRAGDTRSKTQALTGIKRLAPEARHALPAVIEALDDADEQVRESAAFCLAEYGSEAAAAVPALIRLTKDANHDLRELAVWTLWRIRSRSDETVPALIAATQDEDARVARAAAYALADFPDQCERIVPALAAMLDDHASVRWYVSMDPKARVVAATFLSEEYRKKFLSEYPAADHRGIHARPAASYSLGKLGPLGASKLIELSRRDYGGGAIHGLSFCPQPAAVHCLIEMLMAETDRSRTAMRALGKSAEVNAAALIAALQDVKPADRAEVGRALAHYQEYESGPSPIRGFGGTVWDWPRSFNREQATQSAFRRLSPDAGFVPTELAVLTAALLDPDRAKQVFPGLLKRKDAADFRETIELALRFLGEEVPAADDAPEADVLPAKQPAVVNLPDSPHSVPASARVDWHGDPLPLGAVARMGTVRFRHPDAIRSLHYSPDGKTLTSLSCPPAGRPTGDVQNPGLVRVWDAFTGRMRREFTFEPYEPLNGQRLGRTTLFDMSVSADGEKLAFCGKDIRVWDAHEGVQRLKLDRRGRAVLSSSGDRLAMIDCNRDGITLFDVTTGQQRSVIWAEEKHVGSGVAFSPDARLLAVANGDRVRVWDVSASCWVHDFHLSSRWVRFSPDGKLLAALCRGVGRRVGPIQMIQLWDVKTGDKGRTLETNGVLNDFVFSPDGRTLAGVGNRDRNSKIQLWDVQSGERRRSLSTEGEQLFCAAFSPDGAMLAVGGTRRVVRLWHLASGTQRPPTQSDHGGIYALASSPNGRTVATSTRNQTIRLWDGVSGEFRDRLGSLDQEGHYTRLVFSPDGDRLAAAGTQVKMWNLERGSPPQTLGQEYGQPASVTFSEDGQHLFAVRRHSLLKWNVTNGEKLLDWGRQKDELPAESLEEAKQRAPDSFGGDPSVSLVGVALSPGGQFLASAIGHDPFGGGSDDGDEHKVLLWDVQKQAKVDTIDVERTIIGRSLTFSPDGHLLAWSTTGSMAIFDVHQRRTLVAPSPRGSGIRSFDGPIALSPDSRIVATVADRRNILLWEMASGQRLLELRGHHDLITGLVFSADGKQLFSAAMDDMALVWDLPIATRELDPANTTADDPGALWKRLAAKEPGNALRAVWALVEAGPPTVELISKKLTDAKPTDEETNLPLQSPVQLQRVRSVQILEQIGTAEAVAALKQLAAGPEAAIHVQEARAAVSRIDEAARRLQAAADGKAARARHREQRVQHALQSPAVIEITNKPLGDVVDYLADHYGVEFRIDPGVPRDYAITGRLKDMTLSEALTTMLRGWSLEFQIDDGRIVIQTREFEDPYQGVPFGQAGPSFDRNPKEPEADKKAQESDSP